VAGLTCFQGIPSKYMTLKQDLYSTDPQDDLAAQRGRLGKRVDGTCEWILDRPEYRSWLSNPDIQLLRLVGEPGIGKSMISSFLVEELEKKCKETKNVIFAYTFDNRDEDPEQLRHLYEHFSCSYCDKDLTYFNSLVPTMNK
jgi:hypothetical protein